LKLLLGPSPLEYYGRQVAAAPMSSRYALTGETAKVAGGRHRRLGRRARPRDEAAATGTRQAKGVAPTCGAEGACPCPDGSRPAPGTMLKAVTKTLLWAALDRNSASGALRDA